MPKTIEELEKSQSDLGASLAQLQVELKKALALPADDERRAKLKSDIEALGLFKKEPDVAPNTQPAKKGFFAEIDEMLTQLFE